MRLAIAPVLVLAFAGAAQAGGPSPGLLQGSTGLTNLSTPFRFVTLPGPATTTLTAIDKRTGDVTRWRTLRGSWGIPLVAFDGTPAGLSRDGKTLVVSDWVLPPDSPLRAKSTFRIYDTKLLTKRWELTLHGDWTFDALSPDAGMLYLIQHVSRQDVLKYQVRAYDLRRHRLLKRVIADKSQQGWVMQGMPIKRVASPDGRWVYTLYGAGDGDGYPFVHALDAVNGTAHCIGIPWTGNQDPLGRAVLRLDGANLVIAAGGHSFAIDRQTFALSLPARERDGGFPIGAIAGIAAGGTALLALAAFVALRRRPGTAGVPA
jgi:hypothetical protein